MKRFRFLFLRYGLLSIAFCSNISSKSFITEVINNTDTAIIVRSIPSSGNTVNILVSESLKSNKTIQQSKDSFNDGNIIFLPRTKNIIHGLVIPSIDVDTKELSTNTARTGINFAFTNRHIVAYNNPNYFFDSGSPFFTLRQIGDLLSILSYSGSIQNFNFFGEDIVSRDNNQGIFDGIAAELVTDKSFYSIEVNQLYLPRDRHRPGCSTKAYFKGSISIAFKKNNIDPDLIKSKLVDAYPYAHIFSFTPSTIKQGTTNATIAFNKIVTNLFVSNFCEYIKTTNIGKYLTIKPFYDIDKQCLLFCTFYTQLKQEDLQSLLDHINKIRLSQYNF